jgi:hypothetical protein
VEPKKVLDRSTRNKLARTSNMLVPKTARAKEKTNLRPRGFSIANLPLIRNIICGDLLKKLPIRQNLYFFLGGTLNLQNEKAGS